MRELRRIALLPLELLIAMVALVSAVTTALNTGVQCVMLSMMRLHLYLLGSSDDPDDAEEEVEEKTE